MAPPCLSAGLSLVLGSDHFGGAGAPGFGSPTIQPYPPRQPRRKPFHFCRRDARSFAREMPRGAHAHRVLAIGTGAADENALPAVRRGHCHADPSRPYGLGARHMHLLRPGRRRAVRFSKDAAHPEAPANGVGPGEPTPAKENRGPLPKGAGFQQRAPRYSPRGGGASVGLTAITAQTKLGSTGDKEKIYSPYPSKAQLKPKLFISQGLV